MQRIAFDSEERFAANCAGGGGLAGTGPPGTCGETTEHSLGRLWARFVPALGLLLGIAGYGSWRTRTFCFELRAKSPARAPAVACSGLDPAEIWG